MSSRFRTTMVKSNAQKQKDYRERKKLEDPKFLEKECKRQKANYVKTSTLSKNELKKRRTAVKERVRRSRDRIKTLLEQIRNESGYTTSSTDADTDGTISPMIVAIPFPKKGEASRKRKRQSDDRLHKRIRKLENQKKDLKKTCNSLRKQIARSRGKKDTPNSKTNKIMRTAGINPKDAAEIKKKLLFAETLSGEIREAGKERKNSKKSIRSIISGEILKKYRLLRYAATKTATDRRKLSKVQNKVINPTKSKRGFEPKVYAAVINFYNRDDVSTALPGKRDAKKVKTGKPRIQKRVLNDYLNNLHQKFVAEHINMSCSFASFARMRPKNFVLANFANRRTCLCTQHQNYALKLKMLRKFTPVPTNPEAFVKNSDEKISSIIHNIKENDFTYDVWKKVEVTYKGKASKKMKLITQTISHAQFEALLHKDTLTFRSHISRIAAQFKEQKYLKENLPPNHVYIHMDFAEDYRCRSQNEIQSAYWSPTQVTIHPVVMYYKQPGSQESTHKSFVFISNESRHDATFIYTLIGKLVPLLKQVVPNLQMVHYWTDSPTSQYRNKTIFKILSCHEEYFGVMASWNYMEAGHGKGPCDPIGGVAKRKADQAVKNGKYVIQDATDFYEWAKQDASAIVYSYLSTEDYENSANFLKVACENVETVKGTMKVHGVFSLKVNSIWVRDTSCFCRKCFNGTFQKDSCCKGWRECSLTSSTEKTKNKSDQNEEVCAQEVSGDSEELTRVVPEPNDYVAALYSGKPYIGQVQEIDEEDEEAHISFLEHKGNLQRQTKFKRPQKEDKIWIPLKDIICIVTEPWSKKRSLEILPEVLDNVLDKLRFK